VVFSRKFVVFSKPLEHCFILFHRMARKPKKENLPTKMCPVCDRPFTWRKKWERDWENVKYCSGRCKSLSKKSNSNE